MEKTDFLYNPMVMENPSAGAAETRPDELLLVQTTVNEAAQAETIGKLLVEENLCACAQVGGPVSSIYRWRGRVENEREYLLTAKTTRARYAELRARLLQVHPYELPEIVAVAVCADAAYAGWVREQCR